MTSYTSKRVYRGVQTISPKDAAVNRRAVDDAFARLDRHDGWGDIIEGWGGLTRKPADPDLPRP